MINLEYIHMKHLEYVCFHILFNFQVIEDLGGI